MKIHKIQLEKCHQLKSDSRDRLSSMRSEPEDSKQTYTAIIFNDPSRSNDKEKGLNHRKQSAKSNKSRGSKGCTNAIQNLLTINSLSKLVTNQKYVNNGTTLFLNVKLNNSIDKQNRKALQRPVSAFTKTHKINLQGLQIQHAIKESSFRESRQLSLSGKNILEDSAPKPEEKQQQKQSTYHKHEMGIVQPLSNYGYIAKSRLLSGKEGKKTPTLPSEKERSKKALQYESAVNFQSLHKNLLINNRSSKNKDNVSGLKNHHLQKRHKHSSNGSLKAKYKLSQPNSKQNSSTLIVVNNERNSVYTLADKKHSGVLVKNNENVVNQFTNQFHKNHSKISLTTGILKSMKKGKCTKEKILQLTKYSLVEPKLLIQNVSLGKKVESLGGTPSNTSFSTSQNNITKYLTKLSYSMKKKKKTDEKNQSCALTVQCKKVTYF